MVKLKQGIVRPPFISVIVPTKEDEWMTEHITERIDDRIVIVSEKRIKRIGDLMPSLNPRESHQQIESGQGLIE